MAVQKKRRTISRRRMAYSHVHMKLHDVVQCSCGAFRRSHRACSQCGMYKGAKVL